MRLPSEVGKDDPPCPGGDKSELAKPSPVPNSRIE